ncbi:MAG TPA: peptide chain release factor N(5)-glutamine methyltransferase [Mycobacteriales bacterium]|nr:peptide chain release factor N(5)-glutamine methyltransferase [Mycobacteriales bacterium]
MTITVPPLRQLLDAGMTQLADAGVCSPRHDAEALAAFVLDVPRTGLAVLTSVNAEQAERFGTLIQERARRVPLQHLTGRAGFRRIELTVGPGVFVPRPETEVLVGWCLAIVTGCSEPLVVDLCAGSGAVALSIAVEHTRARVHAVEREAAAFAWLDRNAAAIAPTVVRHHAEAAVALPELDGLVDLVVANPPYIPVSERAHVEVEVREHDPAAALWGGVDGLDGIRTVERSARRLLRPGGWLAVEHSDRQGRSVPGLLTAAGGWSSISDHPDLAGRDRFTTAAWVG